MKLLGRSQAGGVAYVALASVVSLAVATPALGARFVITDTPVGKPVPNVTPSEAIADLNADRSANGIPGDLTANTRLNAGCANHVEKYVATRTQFPHTELPSQPGYTPLGAEAASQSDLIGLFTEPVRGRSQPREYMQGGDWWGLTVNPWTGAPLHEAALFDPSSTEAWYAEKGLQACSGTRGTRGFPTPAFYSYPGSGAANVATVEPESEQPFTPATAAGYPTNVPLGPPIILWAEGTSASLVRARLTSAGGEAPIRVVTPTTPAPAPEGPGFERGTTVGGNANYVVPTELKPAIPYELIAEWATAQGAVSTQTVRFTTTSVPNATTFDLWNREVVPPEVRITASWHRPTVTLTPATAGIRVPVVVLVESCRWVYSTANGGDQCYPTRHGLRFRRRLSLGTEVVHLTVPHVHKKTPLSLVLEIPAFRAAGHAGISFTYNFEGESEILTPSPPRGTKLPKVL